MPPDPFVTKPNTREGASIERLIVKLTDRLFILSQHPQAALFLAYLSGFLKDDSYVTDKLTVAIDNWTEFMRIDNV